MKASSPKVILVTGCSSGFGLRIAVRLASKEHYVYGTMRNLGKKQFLLDEAIKRKALIRILRLDVNHVETINETVQQILKKHERIDVLINNAGFAVGGSFEDLTQQQIREQMETNFFGVQNVIRAVLPAMRKQRGGKIINVTSIAGLYSLPGFGAYNASKWALEGFSESLYYELKPFGINVCLIEPGTYKTKIFYENRQYAKDFFNPQSPYYHYSQYLKNKIDESVAVNTRDPEDIARLVEELVSRKNPPFRNFTDGRSKFLFILKRFLPFSIFSALLYRALFSGAFKKAGPFLNGKEAG